MVSSRIASLSAFAALLSLAVADPNSVCLSFGVDFVDDTKYFINTASPESFTCVSTFQGCNAGKDLADVLLVDPNGDEYLCSSVPTTPADTPELSTCPIRKSQMFSGDWMILILGNNDDGNPFAWERDLYLDCGPQVTSTVTSTVTYNVTTTPTISTTSTTIITSNYTIGPTATYTVPSKTAQQTVKVTPKPVTSTIVKTFTKTLKTWTKELTVTTKTKTASCTVPPKPTKKDKKCTYSPTLLHPAALATPTAAHRYMRKADRAVDVEYARERIAAAKLKRESKAIAAPVQLEERAPDAPTLTVTALNPANTTVTYTASTTVTESYGTITTTTITTSIPPVTLYSGVYTSTITLPTPTKSQVSYSYTTIWTTKTIHATFTRVTTVTPTASVSACRSQGGHYGYGRL